MYLLVTYFSIKHYVSVALL